MGALGFSLVLAIAAGCLAWLLAGIRITGRESPGDEPAWRAGSPANGSLPARLQHLVALWPWPAPLPPGIAADRLLARAGWFHPGGEAAARAWLARLVGAGAVVGAAAGAIMGGLLAALPVGTSWWLAASPAGYFLGRRLVLAAVQRAGGRRSARVRAGLPEWLEDVALAARGGLSLRQAIEVANSVGRGPLVEDARLAFSRVRAGQPLREALIDLSRLYPEPDLAVSFRILVEAEARGLPLAETLEDHVRLLRDLSGRHRQRQLEALPFWLSLITMGLLLPPVFVVTLLPNVLQFLRLYR